MRCARRYGQLRLRNWGGGVSGQSSHPKEEAKVRDGIDRRLARVTSPVALRVVHATLLDALDAAVAGGQPYATFHGAHGERHLGYAAAREEAWRWSRLLRARGLRRGDRVALLLPTGPSFVTALLGVMMAGGVPVPLAAPMTFGGLERYLQNLAAIVADAEVRIVVTTPRVRDAALAVSLAVPEILLEADLDGAPAAGPHPPSLGASDTALLQYTSGTTGRPKGVVVSHRALLSNAFAIAHGLALRPTDVGVSWLPLFHDMGLIGVVITAIAHPYPIHLISPESFVMGPRRWLELISRVKGTISCAPNFAYELCTARAGDTAAASLASLRVLLNGAEPVLRATVDRFTARFGPLGLPPDVMLPVYGMAESTLAVTFPTLGAGLEAAGPAAHAGVSVGRPVAGASIAVTSESGEGLEEGAIGEIRIGGPSLMDGYFRNDAASAAVLSGGWLRSGDLGFVDDGRLFVTGRVKEVIIQGGRNVHAYDVERVAAEVNGLRVGGIAAFARANEASGTDDLVVVAETLEKDGGRRDRIAREVRGEVLAALGVRVDEVRLCAVGAVPRTTSGKIRRRECARLFLAEPSP